MIADSPYNTGELVLKPLGGILGGFVGAILMIGSIILLEPISNIQLPDALKAFGDLVPFLSALGLNTEMDLVTAGAVIFIFGGCMFGLFYALSEQCIPVKGLVADGLFYGFILWIFGGVFIGLFLGEETRSILRSWTFLIHALLYGFCLSFFAIIAQSLRSTSKVTPRD
jgi:drug/metabolite transporter (DMT)-like permease